MKIFLSLFFVLLISFVTLSQTAPSNKPEANLLSLSCEELVRMDIDSTNGSYTRSIAQNMVVSSMDKKGLTIVLLEMDGVIVFSITVAGAGDCVDENSNVKLAFRDGSKLELLNNGGFNCDAESSLYFGGGFGRKKELEKLRSFEIQYLRVETRKSSIDKSKPNFVEEELTADQSKLIMKTIDCLLVRD